MKNRVPKSPAAKITATLALLSAISVTTISVAQADPNETPDPGATSIPQPVTSPSIELGESALPDPSASASPQETTSPTDPASPSEVPSPSISPSASAEPTAEPSPEPSATPSESPSSPEPSISSTTEPSPSAPAPSETSAPVEPSVPAVEPSTPGETSQPTPAPQPVPVETGGAATVPDNSQQELPPADNQQTENNSSHQVVVPPASPRTESGGSSSSNTNTPQSQEQQTLQNYSARQENNIQNQLPWSEDSTADGSSQPSPAPHETTFRSTTSEGVGNSSRTDSSSSAVEGAADWVESFFERTSSEEQETNRASDKSFGVSGTTGQSQSSSSALTNEALTRGKAIIEGYGQAIAFSLLGVGIIIFVTREFTKSTRKEN